MAYDNSMVAHVWAQQEKQSGKSGNGNFSFSGPSLYSYSTRIARFVDTIDGRHAVLVTSEVFSKTTSCKHMPALWRAIDHGRGAFAPCFTVPNPDARSEREHAANLAHLVAEYGRVASNLKRARDYWGVPATALTASAATARDYATAFGLPIPQLSPESDAADIIAHRAARDAKANAPGAAEKREKARVARIASKERAETAKREKLLADNAKAIADWRAGVTRSRPYQVQHVFHGALLRVSGDELQTSQGARVPLADAIKVYRFVKLCRERGEPWSRNGRTLPVGAFQVDHVQPSGNFRAGCHLITWAEIESAARAAGVYDIDAADTRTPSREAVTA